MVFKLRALRDGAAIASKKLWELNSKLLAQDERNEKEKTRVNVRALASPPGSNIKKWNRAAEFAKDE
jgi:hypothetical protein